jgi:hypothetical protein
MTPFEAVTISGKLPVEAEVSAVTVRVEDALPSAGTVTGPGRLTVIPLGATPLQSAPRLTEELNQLTEVSTIVAEAAVPGVKVITAGVGWVTKSGAVTGARTAGVPAMVTRTWVEWETMPFVAVIRSG